MSGPHEMRLFDMDDDQPGSDPTIFEQELRCGAGVVRGDLAGNLIAVDLDRTRLRDVSPAVLTGQLTDAIREVQQRAEHTRLEDIRRRARRK